MELTARIFHRRQLVRRRVERGIGVGQRRDDLLDGIEIVVARIHAELLRCLTQIGGAAGGLQRPGAGAAAAEHPSDAYLDAVEQIVAPLADAYATLDTTRTAAGGEVSPRSIPPAVGGGEPARRLVENLDQRPAGRRLSRTWRCEMLALPERVMMVGAQLLDMCRTSMRPWSSASSMPGVHQPARRCRRSSGHSPCPVRPSVHDPRQTRLARPEFVGERGGSVAAGDVDMAIGGDQASIRIPASHCGMVGLKPTFGLVPYTGIGLLEITLDTCGPMTANVRDNALLLEVIAGPTASTRASAAWPRAATPRRWRVTSGIAVMDRPSDSVADVDARVRDAAQRFAKLGAIVERCRCRCMPWASGMVGHPRRRRLRDAPGNERRRRRAWRPTSDELPRPRDGVAQASSPTR